MKKNKKDTPFSWKLEEYVFGRMALREEIKRHKKEDEEPWKPMKAVWVRVLYVYVSVVGMVLIIKLALINLSVKLRRIFKKKSV